MVEAGAGTGKTSVLADRFMYLLDRHPDWPLESIVAVTFTKKATREMRSRIRTKVEEMAAGRPDDAAWQERRRGLDRLMVETVHGLCARLLRENAIAAQVDPRSTFWRRPTPSCSRRRPCARPWPRPSRMPPASRGWSCWPACACGISKTRWPRCKASAAP